MILSLDQATTCGWAAGNPGEEPRWGSRTFQGKGNGEVLGLFAYWLRARVHEFRPRLIVFESPYVPHPKRRDGFDSGVPINALTLRRLMCFAGRIEEVAWELKIECREVTPMEVCRFFIGPGRMPKREEKKRQFIAQAECYGWHGVDDNSADALAIWAMAEALYAPELSQRRGVGRLFLPPANVTSPRQKNNQQPVDIGEKRLL